MYNEIELNAEFTGGVFKMCREKGYIIEGRKLKIWSGKKEDAEEKAEFLKVKESIEEEKTARKAREKGVDIFKVLLVSVCRIFQRVYDGVPIWLTFG